MNRINIEGKHLRWFVTGAVAQYFTRELRKAPHGADFDYYVDDTCNRVHKYLTTGRGLDGTASDLQCVIGTEAALAFGVRLGDDVTISW